MGCRVLRCPIWGYTVCLCPIKRRQAKMYKLQSPYAGNRHPDHARKGDTQVPDLLGLHLDLTPRSPQNAATTDFPLAPITRRVVDEYDPPLTIPTLPGRPQDPSPRFPPVPHEPPVPSPGPPCPRLYA